MSGEDPIRHDPPEAESTRAPSDSRRSLWMLIGAEVFGALGSEIARFGVSVWLFEETKSLYAFGWLLFANTVPGLLASPLAGHIVDTRPRKQVLIGASIISMVGTLIVLGGAFFGHLSMIPILVGAGIASVGESFQWPAISSTVPLMTTEDELPRFNGFIESGHAGSMVAGPILGGAMFAFVGLKGLLGIEVFTFLVSIAIVATLTVPEGAEDDGDEEDEESASPADLLFGMRWIFRNKPLFKLLAAAIFVNFFLSVGNALMTPYCLGILSEQAYGTASAFFGGGMIVGGLLYGSLASRFKKNSRIFLAAGMAIGFAYSAYGFARNLPMLAGVEFVVAILITILNSAVLTLWQVKVPKEYSGRVLAAVWMLAECSAPIAYLVTGFIGDTLTPYLLEGHAPVQRWIGAAWGTSKSGQIGTVFSAIGVIVFLGFAFASWSRDVRNVEDFSAS